MPNWCRNTLIVTKGEPTVVLESIRIEVSLFDFNTLIAMPREIADAPADPCMSVPEWYRWSIQNWGTKWNSVCAEKSSTSAHNTVHFNTAWAPPVPVFEALAKRFPDHEFTIYSDEWANHLHCAFLIKDGELVAKNEPCFCFGNDEDDVALTPEASKQLLSAFGAKEAI